MLKNERWFMNKLKKIMEHNDYEPNMITVEECDKEGKWTPVDLVMREYYNNGGGSAKGFLGIYPYECEQLAKYIVENQKELRAMNYYSKEGINNFGISLWDNYNLH